MITPKLEQLDSNHIALIGMPFDDYSSHLKGPAGAPALIREMMVCESANTWSERGMDLGNHPSILDLGDLNWSSNEEAFELLESDLINKEI